MKLENYRLYRKKSDRNCVVVVRSIEGDLVTFLYAPPLDTDLCWLIPPRRGSLKKSDFLAEFAPWKDQP